MKSKRSYTICVEEDGVLYKVSKIFISNDGSFGLDVPYCQYDQGALIKIPTTYAEKESIPYDKIIQGFSSKNRPKLSIHASGFVQFSGNGIISGRDENGDPKGLALLSRPLTDPVRSGPTFSITCWGFHSGFETIDKLSKNTFVYDKSIFQEQHPGTVMNSFVLNGWILPFDDTHKESNIWKSDEGDEMIMAIFKDNKKSFATPMMIIRLPTVNAIIGLLPQFCETEFPKQDPFGFVLSSPTEQSKTDPNTWFGMLCMFPGPKKTKYTFLDYAAPSPSIA